MGVFIISPTDKGGMLYKPPVKLAEACKPFSPIEFNNMFLLKHPEIHTLVIGTARPSAFDEHMKSLQYYEETIADSSKVDAVESKLRSMYREACGDDWTDNWYGA